LSGARRDGETLTIAVLAAFHVVRLGTAVVDQVRRRVQQHTLGHRGHRDDPLYQIRGLLRHGAEHLTPLQIARLAAALTAGDPSWELTVAWHCHQQLPSIYHARAPHRRRVAEKVIASFPTCPIVGSPASAAPSAPGGPQVLAYFDTGG
jgi:transposase